MKKIYFLNRSLYIKINFQKIDYFLSRIIYLYLDLIFIMMILLKKIEVTVFILLKIGPL